MMVSSDEFVCKLSADGLGVIQSRIMPRLSLDSLLLAHFASMDSVSSGIDLGAGTGVISLLLAKKNPALCITAVEIIPAMCDMMRRSVIMNAMQGRIKVINGDFLHSAPDLLLEGYDAAWCNPPFFEVQSSRISLDPIIASARSETCCTLEQVFSRAYALLKTGGVFYIIHLWRRMEEALRLARECGLTAKLLRPVIMIKGESPKRFLLRCERTDTTSDVDIGDNLEVFLVRGFYSPEMREILGDFT